MTFNARSLLGLPVLIAGSLTAVAIAATAPLDRPDLDPADRERIAAILEPATQFDAAEMFEANSGGATTTRRFDRDAFSQPAENLGFDGRSDFSVGNGVFRKLWVAAPSSTTASDGLGPLFNARGCQECHIKDGRGHPPEPGSTDAVSFLLGLSLADGAGEPTYGHQIQDFATAGLPREGDIAVAYEEFPVALNGGETVWLRRPAYSVEGLFAGALDPETVLSPRVAPQMIGLGLLEAVHPNDILAQADPEDADGNGISGIARMVTDIASGEPMIGRFGWQASQPTIADQAATAFSRDMGLSTSLLPDGHGDCTDAQADCRAAPVGAEDGAWEVDPELFDLVVFYSRHLAVPARRDVSDPLVLAGKALFYGAGCTACHTPRYVTSNEDDVPEALRRQLIWPYTDLLTHDMGDDLADRRVDGTVVAGEWRTAPLWGIGLTETVSEHTLFLHDGRARSLLEAILWHGGEAETARDAVVDMTPEERAALITFLESL